MVVSAIEGCTGCSGNAMEMTDCLGEEENEDFLEQVTAELGFESVSSVHSGGGEVHLRQREYETSWHVQGSPNSPSVH